MKLHVLCLFLIIINLCGCSGYLETKEEADKSYSPGDVISKNITARIPCKIPEADIVIAFDATSSMGEEKAWLLDNFESFISNISNFVADPRFAVVSFRDYPSGIYGDTGDWPYRLERDLTASTPDVKSAISNTVNSGGNDWPESYTRVMYESYTDTHVTFRPDARRILIIIGDAIPHDTNIYEGVPELTSRDTLVDPGRDGIANTADDLDLQSVISELGDRNITLFMLLCEPPSGYSATLREQEYQCWRHWCSLTGGEANRIASAQEMLSSISTLMENISED